jgi:hypothetical protein
MLLTSPPPESSGRLPRCASFCTNSRFQQQVKVAGHQGPCETGSPALTQNGTQPVEEIISVVIVVEYLPPFDATHDDVMQRSRRV